MNIRYIGHAALCIEAGGLAIVTDPWFQGPAYCGQWHIFPKPVGTQRAEQADVILISHGHEDHLHGPTLSGMRKDARVFYPYGWYGGIREYLRGLGYAEITEAMTGRTYALREGTYVTYIANNLDSINVIEHQGEIIVNVNDALHAYHPNVIAAFTAMIRERWPTIDAVFCGFGGASYFPNTIHVPGKDDTEVARAREQWFVHSFCRIVEALAPRVAVPFAADFVLLEPWQRWINTVRFPRHRIGEYFRRYFPDAAQRTAILDMYPGDILEGTRLDASSPYRSRIIDGDAGQLLEEQYGEEMVRRHTTFHITEKQAGALEEDLRENIRHRAPLFSREKLAGLRFTVRVTDVADRPCYTVAFEEREPVVRRAQKPDSDGIVVIETTSEILRCSFGSDWGGDAITIGYGAEVFVREESTVEQGLDAVCVRLLTRHPSTTRHMVREPLRAARFLANNPLTRSWAVRQLRSGGPATQEVAARKDWLRRTKCEICGICDLPLLDAGFSESLG